VKCEDHNLATEWVLWVQTASGRYPHAQTMSLSDYLRPRIASLYFCTKRVLERACALIQDVWTLPFMVVADKD